MRQFALYLQSDNEEERRHETVIDGVTQVCVHRKMSV